MSGNLGRYFSLKNKIIIITGGAGFLGRRYAEAIIEAEGIPVMLDINSDSLSSVSEHLHSNYPGSRFETFKADITSEEDIENVKGILVGKYGKIDVLINNAANNPTINNNKMSYSGRLEKFSLINWNRDVNTGLTGAFICSKIFGGVMSAKRKGVIVNISSDLAIISPDQRLYYQPDLKDEEQQMKPITYSVTKTGLLGLTRYLSTYWIKDNVRCNALVLGGVENGQSDAFIQSVSSRIPMGRLAGEAEYKGTIIYLCSDAASYMNGATIIIDGGRTIW